MSPLDRPSSASAAPPMTTRPMVAARSRWLRAVLPAIVLATLSLLPAWAQPAEPVGHWEGEIDLVSTKLQFMIDLEHGADGWTGTIDIPLQGADDLPLDDVHVEGSSIRFKIANVPGDPSFDGQWSGDQIEGRFSQGPVNAQFTLGRDAVEAPRRPQEPQPPFPYEEEEVTYTNGDVLLAGTLTLPPGTDRRPAAILITGSGAQDRDETLLGHKPFLVLADALTRAGIAVLRVDDRGVGGSSGSVLTSTSEDFARDVLSGIEFLSTHTRIDGRSIGLIGHSEGAVVAPIVARMAPEEVAFTVLLAGTSVSGADVLRLQLELIARANGATDEGVEQARALQEEAIALMASDAPRDEVEPKLRDVVRRQLAANPGTAGLDEESLERMIQQTVVGNLNAWFRFFVSYDPIHALRELRAPTLVLNGSLDLQVDPGQNLWRIGEALAHARNPDYTVRLLEGLNHLFQTATTGSPNEYQQIEETFAPEALEIIVEWVRQRFG